MKLYVAYVVQGGDRGRQIAGRIILADTSMPLDEPSIKNIEDKIEQQTGSDLAIINFMHELES